MSHDTHALYALAAAKKLRKAEGFFATLTPEQRDAIKARASTKTAPDGGMDGR